MSKKTLKEMVRRTLKTYPDTRNCDVLLTTTIWKIYFPDLIDMNFNGGYFVNLNNLKKLPREDTVKRIRAKFQSEGHFYPTTLDVVKRRKLNEDQWREFMRSGTVPFY